MNKTDQTLWALALFNLLAVVGFGLLGWKLKQLQRRVDRLESITRPSNVQITTTGGGGGGGTGRLQRGPLTGHSGNGVQVFEQDPGGRVRKLWPPEPPANT